MNILCINTCLKHSYVAVLTKDATFENIDETNEQHSKTIMLQIDKMLGATNLDIKDINLLAVCVGTGSFTGIRIGLSVAKGLAHALGLEVIPIDTLNLIAYNTLEKCQYVLMKGIADEFFVGDIVNGQAVNQRLMHKDELIDLLKNSDTICTIDDECVYCDFACKVIKVKNISMCDLVKSNLDKSVVPQDLKPLYLRLSQAEMQKHK